MHGQQNVNIMTCYINDFGFGYETVFRVLLQSRLQTNKLVEVKFVSMIKEETSQKDKWCH